MEQMEQTEFTAVAGPTEYGHVIWVRRDPHPAGRVPINMARLEGSGWDPEAADALLRDLDFYERAPGSAWQKLDGTHYGARLRRIQAPADAPGCEKCGKPKEAHAAWALRHMYTERHQPCGFSCDDQEL